MGIGGQCPTCRPCTLCAPVGLTGWNHNHRIHRGQHNQGSEKEPSNTRTPTPRVTEPRGPVCVYVGVGSDDRPAGGPLHPSSTGRPPRASCVCLQAGGRKPSQVRVVAPGEEAYRVYCGEVCGRRRVSSGQGGRWPSTCSPLPGGPTQPALAEALLSLRAV